MSFFHICPRSFQINRYHNRYQKKNLHHPMFLEFAIFSHQASVEFQAVLFYLWFHSPNSWIWARRRNQRQIICRLEFEVKLMRFLCQQKINQQISSRWHKKWKCDLEKSRKATLIWEHEIVPDTPRVSQLADCPH